MSPALRSPHRDAAPDHTTPPSDDDDGVKVLVVDDQPGNLAAIETVLHETGCRLVPAHSADEALLALLDQEFAAIVLDVRMPGMDGLELANVIKQRRRTRDVPILFLTAHLFDESDVLRGYGTGAVDYLTKPVHPGILRSKIAVFVELYRKRRALALTNAALQREVAERERAEEALRVANRELEQRVLERTQALQRADRRKDEFLASLAHELRNPLAPIRSAAELLQAKGLPEATVSQARAILVRQVRSMTRLIDDLLDVSRITTDKLVLQVSPIELATVVAAAVETSLPIIDEREHTLAVDLPPDPIVLHADVARLSQVLSNLLTNAAKYTPLKGRIQITGALENGWVTIRVVDTGIGIAEEMQPRIFDLFAQGEHPRGWAAGGLGIGLSLARRLVEMHGGTMSVKSAGLGQGSEFSIHVPASSRSVTVAGADVQEPDIAPMALARRVLVVDDNEDAAEMLSTLLEMWGQKTRVAHDGYAALDVAREFEPELVLLDLGLPNLDGYDTARRIREEQWGKTTVLVAVTGWGQDVDRARSRDAGFDEHLVKPVTPGTLRALMINRGLSAS